VIERIAPQVDEVIINANRNLDLFADWADKVVADQHSGFQGPLAGFYAGLQAAAHPLMISVPCDSPFLPMDLVRRMTLTLDTREASVALAKCEGRIQPVFCLMRATAELQDSLQAFIESGQRKVDVWAAQRNHVEVEFADRRAFANINSLDELKQIE
jgi:molybdenum cofactor guanylyltransferase